jgi:hypothetical protein
MAKVFHGLKFKPDQYEKFRTIAYNHGYTVTSALEQFMDDCIEAGRIVISDPTIMDYEAEACVLREWLDNGKIFYRSTEGEERYVAGRLLYLLPQIKDVTLKRLVEASLKNSFKPQP